MRTGSARPKLSQHAHRLFLNKFYRYIKYIYDPTRRLFLFGRDTALDELLREPWESLIEVGVGTGRNLQRLHRTRPAARYGGIDASDEMLSLARKRCPWASLSQGFAEQADYRTLLGKRPDRILFSYALSMMQEPGQALQNAREGLALGGHIVVVDFGDMKLLSVLGQALRRHLAWCHVRPLEASLFRHDDTDIEWGPGRYYVRATMQMHPRTLWPAKRGQPQRDFSCAASSSCTHL